MSNHLKIALAVSLAAANIACAHAQIIVTAPWVRATVAQQTSTGAFMELRSPKDARLVEVRSPVASSVELHQMSMENNVMRMRAITGLDLPAGQSVALKPGGYHVMLTGLKQPISAGDVVPLTLIVEDREHRREVVELSVQARPLAGSAPASH